MSRLGGITYSRSTQLYELPRLDWDKDIGGDEGYQKIKEGSGK